MDQEGRLPGQPLESGRIATSTPVRKGALCPRPSAWSDATMSCALFYARESQSGWHHDGRLNAWRGRLVDRGRFGCLLAIEQNRIKREHAAQHQQANSNPGDDLRLGDL